MTANIDIFSYASLTNAVNKLKPARSFILDKVFTTKQNHATRQIYYGKSEATDKLAVFVNPYENPRLVAQLSKTAKLFELPITREKKFFTAEDLAKEKTVGEIFIGDASEIANASTQKVLNEIQELKNRVTRLQEWMAIQALSNGSVEVSQDNIAFKIDYGFVTNTHLVTNTGTDLWSNASSKPLDQIDTYKIAMAKRGYQATDLVLGSAAARDFKNHADVKANSLRNGYLIGNIDRTKPFTDYGNYIGNFGGLDVWEYFYNYTNSSNVSTVMLTTTKALFIGAPTDMTPANQPFRVHTGPIYRVNQSGQVQTFRNQMLLESILDDGKTNIEWRLEQCSLPAIHDADAVVSLVATTA